MKAGGCTRSDRPDRCTSRARRVERIALFTASLGFTVRRLRRLVFARAAAVCRRWRCAAAVAGPRWSSVGAGGLRVPARGRRLPPARAPGALGRRRGGRRARRGGPGPGRRRRARRPPGGGSGSRRAVSAPGGSAARRVLALVGAGRRRVPVSTSRTDPALQLRPSIARAGPTMNASCGPALWFRRGHRYDDPAFVYERIHELRGSPCIQRYDPDLGRLERKKA